MSNYKNFLSSLEASLNNANRNFQDVELIAVSKKKSVTDIQKVIDEGHLSFGENPKENFSLSFIIRWPKITINITEIKK